MAHIVFIAKRRANASFQLTGPAELGRSVECDIFVPDVFTSRRHCAFVPTEDGWVIEDLESRNGLYFKGRRVRRRLLQHGDQIEIGSFTIVFDETDLAPEYSTPIPFGEGTTVVPLMDTLCSGELRPSEYLKASRKKPSWVRAREEAEAELQRRREAEEAAARELEERLNFSDGAELDLEYQVAEDAEEMRPMYVLVRLEVAERIAGPEVRMDGAPVMDLESQSDLAGIEGLAATVSPPAPTTSTAPYGGSQTANLWSQATGTAETVIAPVDRSPATPAPERTGPRVEIYRPSIWERLREWWGERRKNPVNLGGIIESMRENLVRTASVAIVGLGLAIGGMIYYSKPHYRRPDYTKMTADQVKALEAAAKAN